jgi:hypothetical protein
MADTREGRDKKGLDEEKRQRERELETELEERDRDEEPDPDDEGDEDRASGRSEGEESGPAEAGDGTAGETVEGTGNEENLSTVGSGRVDTLFDDIEETIEALDRFPDELESLRRRIEANEGETSGHVRNRVTQDADGLAAEAAGATERLREALDRLKQTV